jgi:hypothetical protein
MLRNKEMQGPAKSLGDSSCRRLGPRFLMP